MKIVTTIKEMQKIALDLKRKKRTIGFIPTMGALHNGHLSLIEKAKKKTDVIIVSIFVNPIQFNQKNDLKTYPKPIREDKKLLEKSRVDILFKPNVKELYNNFYSTYVNVNLLDNFMCGSSRPDHFKGVTTIVAKMFNIILPDYAYFGQKDYQQLLIVKRMVKDLNFLTEIVTCPIIRDKDGLALSSRNKRLNKRERQDALCLYNSLLCAKELIKNKTKNVDAIRREIIKIIKKAKNTKIDYIHIADPNTLKPIKKINNNSKILIALAVFVRNTRLIDNIIIKFVTRTSMR